MCDIQLPVNGTYKLSETIPDYFNGIVLQRHHLPSGNAYGTIKFQLAFNLAVVWMIVFVSLSKGLRSYGKVTYAFTLLPVFGTFILCAKLLGLMPPEFVNVIFPETSWGEFFLNPKSWLAAAQETFLTWGLLGAAIMQIASHNKHKHLLQRDSKRMSSYIFLRSAKDPLPPSLASTPVRYLVHNSFILGEKVVKPSVDYTSESGYQVLRLATELVPATFAVMGSEQVSPFWAVLFYFILIMFGIAQQLAIWHCVITGIMAIKAKVLKSWETTITFFSCACGFILGLPMATEVLCISTFKNGSFRDMFIWHHAPVAEYWPLWARQVGSMIQLLPVLCIPLVAVVQSYRYLNNGPSDILDRVQLLYRPPIGEHMDELAVQEAAAAINSATNANNIAQEDPPPKYTPPPSYTTATGARIAKFLRQSIRRSVRRIANVLGESSSSRQRNAIASNQMEPPPPDYNAVLVEMNHTVNTNANSNDVAITVPDGTPSNIRISTLERLRNLETTTTALTAADVACILRSSFRRSTIRPTNNVRNANFNDNMASLSAQNLVDSAAPIGETSLVLDHLPTSNFENKSNIDNNSSVI
ncbi:hypothetical protein NQ314_014356 [Rhamnusium bicolor]|uniref:Uncharacterized protein n=1 Tax=Rhamnusium bicolor TaxID=1586634 RepID=A0AAV8X4I1_9CUCU|nr:hypothetical protein NQ314_014356 [Rhamnusium bicolor]